MQKTANQYLTNAVCGYTTKNLSEDTTGSEQYRIYEQGASGFVPPSALLDDVYRQAKVHCENMGKSLKVLKETNPPFTPGCFPKAELIFICLPKPQASNFEDQLYIKLTNLKKLLDNGTITNDEFEQQKIKILNIGK
ncbi:MAG: SHOCT domain-containing protein [Syntrophales bacterium]